MKRLLVFAGFFSPHIGGSERGIYELCKRLAQRGYEIDVITCNTESATLIEQLDGFWVYRLPSWNILNARFPIPKPVLTTFKMLFKLLRKNHDLVNTNTRFFVTSLLGLLFAKAKRVCLVHNERGASHSVGLNRLVDIISRIYDHTLGALIVKSAWKTVSNSRGGAEFLKHLGAREAIVIGDGIDADLFAKAEASLKEKLGLDQAIIITYVGRLTRGKGVQDIIAVFPEIQRKHQGLKLLVVGEGQFEDELRKLAERLDSRNILFLGQKSSQEVAEILSITDIFVSPSYSDSFPLSLVEAGCMGVPVVAADVGGVRDIVEDGRTGLLFLAGDLEALKARICQLIDDNPLRESLARNAQTMVKGKFNWDKIVDRWVEELGKA